MVALVTQSMVESKIKTNVLMGFGKYQAHHRQKRRIHKSVKTRCLTKKLLQLEKKNHTKIKTVYEERGGGPIWDHNTWKSL